MEDWKIFNLISKKIDQKFLIKNFDSLRKEVFNLIPNFEAIDKLPKKINKIKEKKVTNFINQKIAINKIDYFFTNAISRSSKTMAECRRIQNKEYKDGTNN